LRGALAEFWLCCEADGFSGWSVRVVLGNFARNSHAGISNKEHRPLELQRFQTHL